MNKKLSVIGDIYSEDVFLVLMDYELTRARRYPAPISLLCIEIIPKASNQETLYAASNLFASALKKHMRSTDTPCVNGNELKIMLPGTDQNGLNSACERMLSIFQNEFETEDGNMITFTLHIGGTTHQSGETLSHSELLKKGHSALEQSKQKGLNTYVILT